MLFFYPPVILAFFIACLYSSIHVLYILPVICKNFNTHGLRITECLVVFLICPEVSFQPLCLEVVSADFNELSSFLTIYTYFNFCKTPVNQITTHHLCVFQARGRV